MVHHMMNVYPALATLTVGVLQQGSASQARQTASALTVRVCMVNSCLGIQTVITDT